MCSPCFLSISKLCLSACVSAPLLFWSLSKFKSSAAVLPGSIYLALLHCHLPPTSLPAYLPAFRKFLELKIISLKNTVTSFPFFAKLCHSICIPYIFVLSVVNCHRKKNSKPYISHILAANISRDQGNILWHPLHSLMTGGSSKVPRRLEGLRGPNLDPIFCTVYFV